MLIISLGKQYKMLNEIECDKCGKIKKKGKYYKIYVSDGYLDACSKKCARKVYNEDFENSIEEDEI